MGHVPIVCDYLQALNRLTITDYVIEKDRAVLFNPLDPADYFQYLYKGSQGVKQKKKRTDEIRRASGLQRRGGGKLANHGSS